MKIVCAFAREVLNALGQLTIECCLELDDGSIFCSAAPMGQSMGPFDKQSLSVDNNGVANTSIAVQLFTQQVKPLLEGREPHVIDIDMLLLDQEAVSGKQWGANVLVATSFAVTKAQAYIHQLSVYELIAYITSSGIVSIPSPMFNCINAGVHSSSPCPIQEILVVPVGYDSYAQALYATQGFYTQLAEIITAYGYPLSIGDEGGFVINVSDEELLLDLVMQAIDASSYTALIALDVAAGQLYDAANKQYRWSDGMYTTERLLDRYRMLVKKYPIFSIEDPVAPTDTIGWSIIAAELKNTHIIADDISVTDPQRIHDIIELYDPYGFIIKPNQIGTVTQAIQAIQIANKAEKAVIISHRSGDTCDSIIADLAVGVRSLAIKAGGLFRGERTCKYNRLLAIEQALNQYAQRC